MLARTSLRAWLVCTLVAIVNTQAWSETRHIEVKAVDVDDRPLIDATVMITLMPEPPKFVLDEVQPRDSAPLTPLFAQTNASGSAKVDVSALDALAPDQPLRVMVWKKGYGPQTATAQKQVRLRCQPVVKRRFQIVDSENRPLAGLPVHHLHSESVALEDQAKLVWWTDGELRTNEFGVLSMDGHPNGSALFEMVTADGIRHQAKLRRSDRTTADLRDLLVVRLSRYGKLTGQMPAEFARDYSVRLIPKLTIPSRPVENATWIDTSIKVQPDGKFSLEAVVEGIYWLVVSPKPSSERAQLKQLPESPQVLQQVQVVADQTASVSVNAVSLAKVSGRLATKTSGGDFANAQVIIRHELPPEPPFPPQRPPYGRVSCLADGTFECWLPPGRYELACVAESLWSADQPLMLDVGNGAATVTAGQLKVSRTQPAKIVWQSGYRIPNYLQNHSDHRFVFSYKDLPNILCNLTDDGYGQIFAPVGTEPTGIHQNVNNSINPRPNSVSAFVDLDPSENFRLEQITKNQGFANNISLRGRVVDTLGNGIANWPVELAVDYKIDSGGGMQGLDRIKTEADGSFMIPPRQFLGHREQDSFDKPIQGTFTFSAFILANPEPVQVRKVISLKSQPWDISEIEFPDLVVDPLLANKRLDVRLRNANGQPAAGEFIQLADQRRLIGAIAEADGRVEIDNMTGPTWLLRSSDWSIHAIENYDQPVTLALESNSQDRVVVPPKPRMSLEQRRALARQILQAVPKLESSPAQPLDANFQPLSDEAYLSPDESFPQVLRLAGPAGDAQRLQYAKFWHKLSDERLEQLVAAMETDIAKMELLRVMADRAPSAKAYARVMDAIPFSNQSTRFVYRSGDELFEQVADVGLKLHNRGALDPYRDKIRQFIRQMETARASIKVVGPPGAFMSQSERKYGSVCRALIDPEHFASETLELLSTESGQLNYEQLNRQSTQSTVFAQLFPNEHEKLPLKQARVAMGEEMMISWGEQSPLNALAAFKKGLIAAEQLRDVAASSMLSHHADAGTMAVEANRLLVRAETPQTRFNDTSREIALYRAARRISPALGRQQAWLLARDYLNGRYEVNAMNILPIQDQLANRTLAVAYCLTDEYPQLSQQIVRLGVPRVLDNLQRQTERHYWDRMDMALVTWFEPQAACELLIKLSQRYAEEMQNAKAQPAGQPGQVGAFDPSRIYMANDLAAMRHACLRGLLLDELD